MPTFSTSLALMTCVGVSTHFWDSEIVHIGTHVQDGHQLVRSMLSHCKQPTVVGTREDQRVTLSQCVYKVNTFGDYCEYGSLSYCLFSLVLHHKTFSSILPLHSMHTALYLSRTMCVVTYLSVIRMGLSYKSCGILFAVVLNQDWLIKFLLHDYENWEGETYREYLSKEECALSLAISKTV